MMQPVRTLAVCSAFLLPLACFVGPAESKLVRYEVNGQVYSYSTNNARQVERARSHMEAARAADQQKAERAANPLSKLLSWMPEAGAAQPQPQPQQGLSEPDLSSATVAERGRERREDVRPSRRRATVGADPPRRRLAEHRTAQRPITRRQVAQREVSESREPARPQAASGTAAADRTGSLAAKPSSYSQMVKHPADPQAYMMAFVEQVRGKSRPAPPASRAHEP